MESTTLEKAILQAIIWADGFDLALSPFEIWQQCQAPANLNDVLETIKNSSEIINKTFQQSGLVGLKGREDLISKRTAYSTAAWYKFKKIKRLARVISKFPFIRMVAVCNTLALAHGKPSADLDLFIVTQSNRLWSARILCVAAAKLLGGRPSVRKATNRYCLSFYVSEDNLNIQRFISADDHYLTAWTSWVLPIYSAPDYVQLFEQTNEWVKKSLPQTSWLSVTPRWQIKFKPKPTMTALEQMWPDWVENILTQLQYWYLPTNLKNALAAKTTSVVTDNTTLKFHLNDKRELINQNYLERITKYG